MDLEISYELVDELPLLHLRLGSEVHLGAGASHYIVSHPMPPSIVTALCLRNVDERAASFAT